MVTVSTDDPVAVAVVAAIRTGDVDAVGQLLAEHDWLATARLGDDDDAAACRARLLHVATDWPGHFPDVATTIALLVAAGADVGARFRGPHEETPLHWAASSDDVAALDALIDAGADIDAGGGVIGGGTPLADARAFKQWAAAQRLVERGASTTLHDEATLGLLDRVEGRFAGDGVRLVTTSTAPSGAPATEVGSTAPGSCSTRVPTSTSSRRGSRSRRSTPPSARAPPTWSPGCVSAARPPLRRGSPGDGAGCEAGVATRLAVPGGLDPAPAPTRRRRPDVPGGGRRRGQCAALAGAAYAGGPGDAAGRGASRRTARCTRRRGGRGRLGARVGARAARRRRRPERLRAAAPGAGRGVPPPPALAARAAAGW